jgi:cysteine desulfurase
MFPQIKPSKKLIYLDHAATTPLDPIVQKAMAPFWHEKFGNPSSLYKQGIEAKRAVEDSRKKIADLLGARPNEIIFTAGGTESVNLAIFGVARQNKHGHIVTSKIEHHAVLKCCEALAEPSFASPFAKASGDKKASEGKQGSGVSYVNVDAQGFINLDELKKAIRPRTVLVSVMYANNEVGTIEPIAEIAKIIRKINLHRTQKNLPPILFHTDACQAAGALDLNVNRLGVDLLTLNGSKIYGPKQTGILYVRTGVKLHPLVFGGGQEHNLRSGTENVPGIVGLARALELAEKNKAKEVLRLEKLRDYFIKRLLKISGVSLNGPRGQGRLANNVNICADGVEGEALMLYLDGHNIAVSTGSACATSLVDPSHVIMALGKSAAQAQNSIRMTLGKATTKQELDYVLKVLPGLVTELRKIR